MKKKYRVRCVWTVESVLEVEAETGMEAKDIAFDTDLNKFQEPQYVDESFKITNVEEK